MSEKPKVFYEFGPFRLDEAERRLLRGGAEVTLRENGKEERLPPKAFDLLLALVKQGGHKVGREELIELLWPGQNYVTDNRLSDEVSTLRKFLGDRDKKNPSFIETLPRHGYRFVADVREVVEESVTLVERTRTHVRIEEEREPAPAPEPEAQAVRERVTAPELPAAAGARRRFNPLAVASVCVLAVALAVALYFALRGEAGPPAGQAPLARSIAVLPFKPLVAESRDPALELGMTDALISKLSSIRQITVRPTSAVMKYAAEGQDLRAAGAELGADVLLDGKVQRAGDRVRLSVQLVRASDGATLWAEKFDEKFTDIFTVQDAVSERAAAALALKLTGEERRGLAKRYTENVEAYQLYMQGRQHWRTFTREGREKSINYYNEALRLDPDYALAYAGLANTYIVSGIYGPPTPAEVMPKAREAIRRALELDEGLAEAHVSSGAFKIFYERDWPGAERELRRAMELNPSDPDAPDLYGYYLIAMGRTEEAVSSHRRAAELAPQWHIPAADLLDAVFFARRFDEAIGQCRQMLRLEPGNGHALGVLTKSLNAKGLHDEAATEALRGLGMSEVSDHRKGRLLAELGYAYAAAGRRAEAAGVIERLKERRDQWMPIHLAKIYAGAGDREQSFAWLTKAADDLFPFLYEVRVEPHFDGLRTDPRFRELMRRLNLPL